MMTKNFKEDKINQDLDISEIENILDFSMQVNKLKFVKRYSELKKYNKKFKEDDSASHSWRVALMTLLLAEKVDKSLDIKKMLEIAIVHDLAETITGDIDALLIENGSVQKKDKQKNEMKAMSQLLQNLPSDLQEKIMSIWEDYEYGKSEEAKFVKVLDKMEAQTHIFTQDAKDKYDAPNFILHYADKPLKHCKQLKEVAQIIKNKIKIDFEKQNIKYDD
jgi:putative hydrolase of HD superfamily